MKMQQLKKLRLFYFIYFIFSNYANEKERVRERERVRDGNVCNLNVRRQVIREYISLII